MIVCLQTLPQFLKDSQALTLLQFSVLCVPSLPRFLRYLISKPISRIQGVTVYRAIKYSQTEHGDWIVIPGAGGGLGHLAVQYAVARGLRVIAIGG